MDRFTFEKFNLSPLEMKAVLASSLIQAEIERGVVCGVNTTGSLELTGKDIDSIFNFPPKTRNSNRQPSV